LVKTISVKWYIYYKISFSHLFFLI
jgi:hypothetical protein